MQHLSATIAIARGTRDERGISTALQLQLSPPLTLHAMPGDRSVSMKWLDGEERGSSGRFET